MSVVFAASIPSAVTEAECHTLAALANGLNVLEVGSQYGRSTIALASTAARVYALDWHRGDPQAGQGDTLMQFWHNLLAYGVRDKVVPLVGDVAHVVGVLARGVFGGVFLDAYHERDVLEDNISILERVVAIGGWMTFHDYSSGFAAEVQPPVDALAARWTAEVHRPAGTLAVIYKPR